VTDDLIEQAARTQPSRRRRRRRVPRRRLRRRRDLGQMAPHPSRRGRPVSARLSCWLRGHRWGNWDRRTWQNLLGAQYRVRWCAQCGAMGRRPA
jgi:hypothetical protein